MKAENPYGFKGEAEGGEEYPNVSNIQSTIYKSCS